MYTATLNIKHSWVWGSAILIYFFNTFLLPEGLSITLLLTPVWFYCLSRQNMLQVLLAALLPIAAFALIHFSQGADTGYYLLSATMLACIIIFILFAATVISDDGVNWDLVFRDIVLLNFLFCLASIPMLYSEELRPLVWYEMSISKGIETMPRLKMFTSEASHYSFLLAPLIIYFSCRAIFFKTKRAAPVLLMLGLPLVLSFSLGVMLALLTSFTMLVVVYARRIFNTPQRRKRVLLSIGSIAMALIVFYILSPDHALFQRLANVLNGEDTSANGRTYEALLLAHNIAGQKSLLWGLGPGQLKIAGRPVISEFYNYMTMPDVVRIPNAIGETIVSFGYAGLFLRLATELFLFIKTRVYQNPFRLWLFIFIFIYQFTGSYITNAAEYLAWLFVFIPVFPVFKSAVARPLLATKNLKQDT